MNGMLGPVLLIIVDAAFAYFLRKLELYILLIWNRTCRACVRFHVIQNESVFIKVGVSCFLTLTPVKNLESVVGGSNTDDRSV